MMVASASRSASWKPVWSEEFDHTVSSFSPDEYHDEHVYECTWYYVDGTLVYTRISLLTGCYIYEHRTVLLTSYAYRENGIAHGPKRS